MTTTANRPARVDPLTASLPTRFPVAWEQTPIHDALREYPTADPCRRAYLRDVMAGKRGAA